MVNTLILVQGFGKNKEHKEFENKPLSCKIIVRTKKPVFHQRVNMSMKLTFDKCV